MCAKVVHAEQGSESACRYATLLSLISHKLRHPLEDIAKLKTFQHLLETGRSELPSARCFDCSCDLAQVCLGRRPMLVHGQSDVSPETR